MSGAKWLLALGRLFLAACISGLGWIIIVPIAFIIPKKRNWIAVLGRQNGQFLDNAKYFYLQADQEYPQLRIEYVTENHTAYSLIKSHGGNSLIYPDFKSIWYLLRCSVFVADEASWHKNFRAFLLMRAKSVQLWHGVGFKWIEANLWKNEVGSTRWASFGIVYLLRILIYRLNRRRIRYDVVLATSEFYLKEVFSTAFVAKHFIVEAYPRNDFSLSLNKSNQALAWSNVDSTIKDSLATWGQENKKLVLIAPTFRGSGSMPMQLNKENFNVIDRFGKEHGVIFIFKFHPLDENLEFMSSENLYVCHKDSDVYPLFPYFSALIADYSSITSDFLLVDKPVLFYIPEGDDYTIRERQLQFDPFTMMPGPIAGNWGALLNTLLLEWKEDSYALEREKLRRLCFDDTDQKSGTKAIISFMQQQDWID